MNGKTISSGTKWDAQRPVRAQSMEGLRNALAAITVILAVLVLAWLILSMDTPSADRAAPEPQESPDNDHKTEEHKGGHEEPITLSSAAMAEFGIRLSMAGSGTIAEILPLPGEIAINPGRLVHIVPRVSGITNQVYKELGDRVEKGELLATLSSRELAETRAELEAAHSRYQLASVTYDREHKLKNEGITSEREYLEAKQARDAAYIDYNLAKQKLKALGIQENHASTCAADCDPTLYEIHSPENGIIIEKHIVQGELLNGESQPFAIANLDEVWINITVNQKDIQKFHLGQKATISTGINGTEVQSEIDYISPTVSEETRSATVRVVIDNKNGNWRPGLFVTANVQLSETEVAVVIPKTALEQLHNQTVVFKKTAQGFVPQKITTGREDHQSVEVLSGLNAGDEYVADHAFVLKAELGKGEAEHDHD